MDFSSDLVSPIIHLKKVISDFDPIFITIAISTSESMPRYGYSSSAYKNVHRAPVVCCPLNLCYNSLMLYFSAIFDLFNTLLVSNIKRKIKKKTRHRAGCSWFLVHQYQQKQNIYVHIVIALNTNNVKVILYDNAFVMKKCHLKKRYN